MMRPSTAMKQWDKEVAALKKKLTVECEKRGIKGAAKSRKFSKASSALAKKIAKLVGMKSIGEVRCAADLEERGIAYSYENTTVPYQHKPQHYTPDFDIYNGDKKIFIEYKGKLDKDTRKKLLAIKRCNPKMEICIVFEKANNKIMKGSKTTYGMWADKNKFKWSEAIVDERWIK